MAWESLYEYALIKRKTQAESSNSRLSITVEPMVELSEANVFKVTPSNIMKRQIYEVSFILIPFDLLSIGK